MAFDKPRNGDKVVKVDGFSIVVDDLSAEMLNGARIDFVQDLNATGFEISAPNLPPTKRRATARPTGTRRRAAAAVAAPVGAGADRPPPVQPFLPFLLPSTAT